jgi:hypothetical protein
MWDHPDSCRIAAIAASESIAKNTVARGARLCYSSVPALLNTRSVGKRKKTRVDGIKDKPHNIASLLLNKTIQQVTQNSLKINSR